MQAMRAVCSRCATESRGVIARKAGTTAIGSTITNNELNAKSAYSTTFMGGVASVVLLTLNCVVMRRGFRLADRCDECGPTVHRAHDLPLPRRPQRASSGPLALADPL